MSPTIALVDLQAAAERTGRSLADISGAAYGEQLIMRICAQHGRLRAARSAAERLLLLIPSHAEASELTASPATPATTIAPPATAAATLLVAAGDISAAQNPRVACESGFDGTGAVVELTW
jgi:hypothetical protein